MKSFTSICLNKKSKIPIYKQLGDALLALIDENVLKEDSKLPPIRKMAMCLKINNSTVVNAYKYLESKRAVYSTLGSGTYVSPASMRKQSYNAIPTAPEKQPLIAETNLLSDFSTTNLPDAMFPAKEIKEAFSKIVDRDMSQITNISDCSRLAGIFRTKLNANGINIMPQNIAVMGSFKNAVSLAAHTIIKKGDYVVVESPSPYAAVNSYTELGAQILEVPLLRNGLDLNIFESCLKVYRPKIVHVCTYFQSPTGVIYSLENKKKILELCYKYNTWIVEEDVYSELLLKEKKIFIKSLDYRQKVIYIKNMTKLSLPWFGAIAVIAPKKTIEAVCEASFAQNIAEDAIEMKIIGELLLSGIYDNRNEKIAADYKNIYNLYSDKINTALSDDAEFDHFTTGIGFWVKLKGNNALELAKRCMSKGVLITPGNIYYGSQRNNYFRLCFRNLDMRYADYGFETLFTTIKRKDTI